MLTRNYPLNLVWQGADADRSQCPSRRSSTRIQGAAPKAVEGRSSRNHQAWWSKQPLPSLRPIKVGGRSVAIFSQARMFARKGEGLRLASSSLAQSVLAAMKLLVPLLGCLALPHAAGLSLRSGAAEAKPLGFEAKKLQCHELQIMLDRISDCQGQGPRPRSR